MSVSAVSGNPASQSYQPQSGATGTQGGQKTAQSLQGLGGQVHRHGGGHHRPQQGQGATPTPPTTAAAAPTKSGTNFVV